jgi:hypothetical protein
MAKKRGGRKYGRKASEKVEKVMREQAGDAPQRRLRQESHQPQAGDCDRAFRGPPGGRQSAGEAQGRQEAIAIEPSGLPLSHIQAREAECRMDSSKLSATIRDC